MKRLAIVLLCLVLVVGIVAGCSPKTPHKCESVCPVCGGCMDADCTEEACSDKCPGHPTEDKYEIVTSGSSNKTLDLGQSEKLTYTITKNGTAITDAVAEVTVTGDAVTFDKSTQKVTAVKEGSASVVLSYEGAESKTINYTVVNYFFSREIYRGSFDLSTEAQGTVTISGGQATLVAKQADTKYIFKATITVPETASISTTQSFGVGSFLNNGDNALWFGLRNSDGLNDGVFSVARLDFLSGWGSAGSSEEIVRGYKNSNTGNTITFEIIRNGNDYYYDINGMYGKYTSTEDSATYPGIYSQEIALTVSNFSVSYDQAEVDNAIDGYADKGIGSVRINEVDKNRLVKGASYQFTATTFPVSGGKVVWSIDTSAMTDGQQDTSVDGNGLLTISENAAGTLTLICSDETNTKKDTLTITILQENEVYVGDLFTATGGVQLDEESQSYTFPYDFRNVDGVSNEQGYSEVLYNIISNKNYSGAFSIEFTVSEYFTTEQFPKLQIALGSYANNFYVAYKPDGTCRIESYGRAVTANGTYYEGWWNSEAFQSFDPSGSNTFKISIATNGVYTVTVNGQPLTFSMDGVQGTLVRDYQSLTTELPVKIATKGVSAVVSAITITEGQPADNADWWKYNENVEIDGQTLVFDMPAFGWNNRDQWASRVLYTQQLPGDFTIEYDVMFSNAMDDAKFVMRIGNWEYHINNKISANGTINAFIYKNAWGGPEVDVTNKQISEMLKAHVRLERTGDSIRLIVNGIVVGEYSGADTSTVLEFYAFNGNEQLANSTVTMSDFTLGEYSQFAIYDIIVDNNDVSITEGKTMTILPTATLNGQPYEDALFTFVLKEGEGMVTLSDDGTVTAVAEGGALVVVNLVDSEGNVLKSIEVRFTVYSRPTENDILSVNGGAILNDDGSVTFPTENIDTDGVGDEQNYSNQTYSANLKQVVKGDFTIEFTVSGYSENADYPKLMISLGGSHNQFYVVYNNIGEENAVYRIETFTNTINASGSYWEAGSWCNSADFRTVEGLQDFDPQQPHTFRIAVEGGLYRVYVDDVEITSTFNVDGTLHNIQRNRNDYYSEQPVRISTKGVACTVSDISITSGSVRNFWYIADGDITDVTETSFTITANNMGWGGENPSGNQIVYGTGIAANATVEFDIQFSRNMTDGKFIIRIGGKAVMLCSKTDGFYLNLNDMGSDWGESKFPIGATLTHVKIERVDGDIKIYVNGSETAILDTTVNTEYTGDAGTASDLSFYVFNEKAEDGDITVTVSNLTVA